MMITPAQCRAARGLLKWGQENLAIASEVGVVAVRKFETEQAIPRRATLAAIQRALEAAGVEFIDRGVRLREDVVVGDKSTHSEPDAT